MLFYRFLNLVIASFQIQLWCTLNSSNEVGTTVGFVGTCLLFANVILATIFFLAEFLLTKDSRTVLSMKVIHPYTETPVKILLLCILASSCITPYVDEFNTLQQLVRLDVVVSYISYAWKTFWPLIITPLNRGLMYVNSLALYILRITRGNTAYCDHTYYSMYHIFFYAFHSSFSSMPILPLSRYAVFCAFDYVRILQVSCVQYRHCMLSCV